MLLRAFPFGGRAVLRTLAATGSCRSATGLAPAARCAAALLNIKVPPLDNSRWAPPPLRVLVGGSILVAVISSISSEAECAANKKQKKQHNKPAAAAKKPGPAGLSDIEQALQPNKTYNVEKLLASRLVSGQKQYLVRWEGFAAKHDSWEPMANLSNLVDEMAAFDLEKEKANKAHLKQLSEAKAARQAARNAAGNAGGPSADADSKKEEEEEEKDVPWEKKTARCYEAFEKHPDKPGYARCISTENVAGGCPCHHPIAIYTQSLWNHLRSHHGRTFQELKGMLEPGAPLDGGVVASLGKLSSQTTITAPKLTEERKKKCDRACARWLVKSSRPFTLPEKDKPFRDFIRVLTGGSWDPPNYRNIKGQILEMSAEGQLRVKEFMSDLLLDGLKPCIAGDIWSDRGCSLMGILGYGIDKHWAMREWLLAATPFGATRHTGDAIDQITVDALKLVVPTWTTQAAVYEGVHGKVSDNASNMAKGWSSFDGGFCVAHTLELAVHKFTQAEGIVDTFSRMRGIVGYFHKSTNGIQDLQAIQKRLSLPQKRPTQDVITRWRSSYDMVEWFREQQTAVMTFDVERAQAVVTAGGELGNMYGDNRLQLDDWIIGEQSSAVLATSATITTKLEGTNYPTLSSVLPCVYRLLSELEDQRSLFLPWKDKGHKWVKAGAIKSEVRAARRAFHDDLEERFVTNLPAPRKETMAICTLLDPRFKNYSFAGAPVAENLWANQILKAEFEDKWSALPLAAVLVNAAAPAAAPTATPAATQRPAAAPAAAGSSFSDIFSRPMEEESDEEEPAPAAPPLETDLEKYLKLPELPLTMPDGKPADILSWWKQRDHSLAYDAESGSPEGLPRLARMARQYHSEPASSAGAERLFSAAGRAHHDLKAAMNDSSLEHELLALANSE